MGEKAAGVNHQPPRQSRLAVGPTFGYCPKKFLQYLSPSSLEHQRRCSAHYLSNRLPNTRFWIIGFYYILYSGSCKVSLMSVTVAISPSLQWNHLLRVTKGAKIASAQLPAHLMLQLTSASGTISTIHIPAAKPTRIIARGVGWSVFKHTILRGSLK